ncbi:TPA: hypothetical protein QHK97_002669 [Enterobacter kobei]|nr:hypothetical protein [Enterobacter kobei]ELK3457060.1 hypothetical protein [Enterobacter kobei]HDT4040642.1 hypothetical protein [Enterobacter kobei]
MTVSKPMTGEQLDELMTVAVNMQREAETDCNRPSAMFAYAVQVAVLELRKVRNDCAALAAELQSVKAMNDCLSEELSGYESDGAFEGPKMHLLWWQCETPNHDAFLAEVRSSAVEEFVRMADYSESVADGEVIVTSSSVFAAGHEYAAQLRKGVQS